MQRAEIFWVFLHDTNNILMKRILLYPLLAGAMALAVSCLDTNETETYPQAVITSFTLGYFNVEVHDINYLGNDTTVYVREGGTMYPMTIDQIGNRIYNVDSLAFGSVLDRVMCTITGTGTVLYSYLDEPDAMYVYSSSDSLDFTRGIALSVLSTDESYLRTYSVDVNVHKVFPDSLDWYGIQVPVLEDPKIACMPGCLFMAGTGTDGNTAICRVDMNSGEVIGEWQPEGLEGRPGAMMTVSGKLYLQCGTSVYSSSDGMEWNKVAEGISSLFPICDFQADAGSVVWATGTRGNLLGTVDMETWTECGRAPEGFPTCGTMVCKPLATNPSIMRYVLAGNSRRGGHSLLWTRLSTDSIWTGISVPDVSIPELSDYYLPEMERVCMVSYDGCLYILGDGLETFYQSQDNGITWYACDRYADEWSTFNRYMQLPEALAGYDGAFDMKSDGKGGLWVADDRGNLIRGAIRRLDEMKTPDIGASL